LKTVIFGLLGSPNAGTHKVHGSPLGLEGIEAA